MILITAAGGKVGQHLAEQLSKKGVAARAGFHSEQKAKALKLPGLEAVVLDMTRPDSIAAALKGVDKVFLTAQGAPWQPEQEGNVVKEARKAGVAQLVKVSVSNADKEAFSFGRWNRAIEKEIEASGLPYTFLRPNYFMQNLFGSADSIKKAGVFAGGPAGNQLTPIDAADIAAAGVTALTEPGHAGKIYDLAGPRTLTGPEIGQVFSKVLGKEVKYQAHPTADFGKLLASWGLPGWLVEAYTDLTAYYESGAGAQSSAPLEKLLRRKPTTLEEFLTKNAAAFR